MKIGLLIIASEILEGKILDLNGRFLSDFLKDHQLELHSSLTVRDIEEEIHRGLKFLLDQCDVIVTSGGLGPTKDDLTKDAIGRFLGRQSGFSPQSDQVSRENYDRLGRTYPGKEHVYSHLPQGFVALSNSAGFAPGLFCEYFGKHIICAPGVPREFKAILQDHLGPYLLKNHSIGLFMENFIVRTRRVPEEKIFGEVDPTLWEKLEHFGDVSSLPVMMGVNIGVKIRAQTLQELDLRKSELRKIFEASPVKSSIWHYGTEKLEEVIIALANKKNLSFGFAESCTGGLCSHRVTGVPGSSMSFLGSVVSYDTSVKKSILEVARETVETYGVISTQTAEAMAQGLARKLGADIAVSTTGIAGPTGGSAENPVGTVCIGVYSKKGCVSFRYQLKGDRELLKERFAEAALMNLYDVLADFA